MVCILSVFQINFYGRFLFLYFTLYFRFLSQYLLILIVKFGTLRIMGNCCHKSSKYGAFRHNLDVPLLEDVIPNLSCDSQVVIIRLAGMSDISTSSNFNGMADAYAELRLMPNDPIAGGQKQLSSIKPNTLNPTWVQ